MQATRLITLTALLLGLPAAAEDAAPQLPEVRAQELFTQLAVDLKASDGDCAKAAGTLGPWLDTHQAELVALVPKLDERQKVLTQAEKDALNTKMEPVMLDIMAVAASCAEDKVLEAHFVRLDSIMNGK